MTVLEKKHSMVVLIYELTSSVEVDPVSVTGQIEALTDAL